MTRYLLACLACAAVFPAVRASAEDAGEWPEQLNGRRVRLQGPGIAEGTLVGNVFAIEGETLVLMPEDGGPARRLTWDPRLRVQLSRTTETRIAKGLFEGAAIGGLSMGVPFAFLVPHMEGCDTGQDCRVWVVGAAAAGALVGAAIGVTLHVIGDSWEPARRPARLSLLLAPTRDNGWRAAVAVRF